MGRFHALKTLYYADRAHLQRYGRPITGDRYIAMENGPVPSYAYNAVKQQLPEAERVIVAGALSPGNGARHRRISRTGSPTCPFSAGQTWSAWRRRSTIAVVGPSEPFLMKRTIILRVRKPTSTVRCASKTCSMVHPTR
ncbi:Panacea domain-containing protein [Shinella sp.]|uniref:Panacea domain-containing protein n=1 Tax=Shinella sp. TaxID=1870904 RepID=UPI003917F533